MNAGTKIDVRRSVGQQLLSQSSDNDVTSFRKFDYPRKSNLGYLISLLHGTTD
jgi:hypothetical protein